MNAKQKQSLEAFVRVVAFLEAHPVTGPVGYADARTTLGDVVRRLREHAGTQITGRELSAGELRRQKQLLEALFVQHLRPVVTIARTQIEAEADVRMPAMRMPRINAGVTKILQACDGIIEAARPFEAAFVANGLAPDFLARFIAARNELESGLGGRATLVGRHVSARAGLDVQMRRGRRVLNRLEAVVGAAFAGDAVTLAAWRAAKRAHQFPGSAGARDVAEVPLSQAA